MPHVSNLRKGALWRRWLGPIARPASLFRWGERPPAVTPSAPLENSWEERSATPRSLLESSECTPDSQLGHSATPGERPYVPPPLKDWKSQPPLDHLGVCQSQLGHSATHGEKPTPWKTETTSPLEQHRSRTVLVYPTCYTGMQAVSQQIATRSVCPCYIQGPRQSFTYRSKRSWSQHAERYSFTHTIAIPSASPGHPKPGRRSADFSGAPSSSLHGTSIVNGGFTTRLFSRASSCCIRPLFLHRGVKKKTKRFRHFATTMGGIAQGLKKTGSNRKLEVLSLKNLDH